MKFKYNFLTNTLYRLEGEYAYKISKNNYFQAPQGVYGFSLGKNEQITFSLVQTILKVYYQKQTLLIKKIWFFLSI